MTRPYIPIPETPEPPYPILIKNTTVIPGFGRGSSEMGIPTANVPIDSSIELSNLETGVYFGYVKLKAKSPSLKKTRPFEDVERVDGKTKVKLTYGELLTNENDFEVLPMVMSLGWNPYYKNKQKACELHIMHKFSDSFYGCELDFNILGYIRPELDYVSLELLIQDINLDIKTALEYLEKDGYAEFKDQFR